MKSPAPELPCDCEQPSAPDFSQICRPPKLSPTTQIPYEIALDFSVSEKLEDAADLANVESEKMIQALIIWGLKQIETMPQEDFYNSLAAVADAKC